MDGKSNSKSPYGFSVPYFMYDSIACFCKYIREKENYLWWIDVDKGRV